MKKPHFNVALTPALAMAAPLVVLGFIWLLAVEPRRAAEQAARTRERALTATVGRMQSSIRRTTAAGPVALREFERRTPSEDRALEASEVITSLLNGPAVGGVSHLSIETGAPVQQRENDLDPRIALFHAPISYAPVTVSFDARYVQIGRFFWNLRTLPSTFELRAVDIAPAPAAEAPLMRTTVTLFVLQRAEPVQPTTPQLAVNMDVTTAPEWNRDPFIVAPEGVKGVGPAKPVQPDPVVHTILYSSQNRAALVDGRIVRPGDRLGSGFVRSIEQDTVVFVSDTGQVKRLTLQEPKFRATKR
jgi:hypothetical protein